MILIVEPIWNTVNLNRSNTDSLFTVDASNSFSRPWEMLPIAQENEYLVIFKEIFLFYQENACCVYSGKCMLCVLIRIASSMRF